MRFISKTMHAYIDYPVALGLLLAPMLLGLAPLAANISVATGLAALLLTALTDHKTGLLRVLPYRLHLALDGLVGAAFVVAPVVFGFHGIEAAYFLVVGISVLLVVSAHQSERRVGIA
ncbi:MAG: hypothetical protein AAF264_04415 [Pseudomonadota bacterium]